MKLSDEAKVGALTLGCLLLIGLLFSYAIHKPIDLLAAISPFYFFFIFLLTRGQAKKAGGSNVAWNVIILLVTFLVILIYAIK
jgi:hypothetical protein